MTDKRKTRRRASDDAVNILVDKAITERSVELTQLVAEVNKGKRVVIEVRGSRSSANVRKSGAGVCVEAGSATEMSMFTKVATALGGAAALGLTTLSIAPASIVGAAVMAVAGAAFSGALTKKLDEPNS